MQQITSALASSSSSLRHAASPSPSISGIVGGRIHTAYTITAPNTLAATAPPSLGSSSEPIMLWWLLANMLPMTERMTMAKREMTMLLSSFVSGVSSSMLHHCGWCCTMCMR